MRKWTCLFLQFTLIILLSRPLYAQNRLEAVDAALNVVEEQEVNDEQVGESLPAAETEEPAAAVSMDTVVKTLDVKDQSLTNILDDISKQTGVMFMFPEVVPGRLSLFIEDINVRDLLKIILEHFDQAYYRTNGAVHIMSKDVFESRYGYSFPDSLPAKIVPIKHVNIESLIPVLKVEKSKEGRIWADAKNSQIIIMDIPSKLKSLQELISQKDLPLISREFRLKYVTYNQIKDDLMKLLTEDAGRVEVDDTQTRLTVTDVEENIKKIEDFIKEKDQEVVVPLRATVMRIALNEEHLQGVDWEAIVSDYQAYELAAVNDDDHEKIAVGVLTQEDYDVLIDALDTVGDLRQLISFDVSPTLNKEAQVELDTNDPFWSLRPGVSRTSEDPIVLDSKGFEMQIGLTVKRPGGEEALEMLPRLHWMKNENGGGETGRILKGDKKLRVTMGKNDVVVIGGLIRSEEIEKTRKVPLLGDLPMVGGVFRRERKKFENTEYIIFLRNNASVDHK